MKASLALAIHAHQPVGNFDHVIDRICGRCYRPFLETMARYPHIKYNLHISGCLLEWIEGRYPDIFGIIKAGVEKGQIEMMGGGFYEPVLTSIPHNDRIGQIAMMKKYVSDHFGYEVKGAWIAERVWEPELAGTLAEAGVRYTILDDTHFIYAGLDKSETYGYFVTEDNGKLIGVFPSDRVLRYSVPFAEPSVSVDHMKSVAAGKDAPIFTYGDDMEKFGEWPGTRELVYERKWLERFLDVLSQNGEWLSTGHLSDYQGSRAPLGRVYIPTASYEEMLDWALPASAQNTIEDLKDELSRSGRIEAFKPFLRGGFFRNFLSKYDESNHMHKKMLYVSRKVSQVSGDTEEIRRELYRGQCNCAYWHGAFGGLYLYHLRRAVYEHLLRAEKGLAALKGGGGGVATEVTDFDADGSDEIVLSNGLIAVCVDPRDGGAISEIDHFPTSANLSNVLTRRREAYHRKIPRKGEHLSDHEVHTIHDGRRPATGLPDEFIYDRYRRVNLRDHFLPEDTKSREFEETCFKELGDFADAPYGFRRSDKAGSESVMLTREGLAGGRRIRIEKTISVGPRVSQIEVAYRLRNLEGGPLRIRFGTEFAFIMPDADSGRYKYVVNGAAGKGDVKARDEVKPVRRLFLTDQRREHGIGFSFSDPCGVWRFPIETVSQSEKAYELSYQGTVVFPYWDVALKREWAFAIIIVLGPDVEGL